MERKPCPNPECRDGRTPRKKGMSYRTMSDGRRRPRCHVCWGLGYIETTKAAKRDNGEATP